MGVFVKQDDGWLNLETGASGGGGSAWGDFTTNGDEQASGTYTDSAGRDWKWAEWNADDYSVIDGWHVLGADYRRWRWRSECITRL